jgi:hypothetical protein
LTTHLHPQPHEEAQTRRRVVHVSARRWHREGEFS